jgi:hypothetical protein
MFVSLWSESVAALPSRHGRTCWTGGGSRTHRRACERLAEAREASDPASALGVYLRLTDTVLVDANKGAYRDAVRHLEAARRAATAAALVPDSDEKLASLREQQRRRPSTGQSPDETVSSPPAAAAVTGRQVKHVGRAGERRLPAVVDRREGRRAGACDATRRRTFGRPR